MLNEYHRLFIGLCGALAAWCAIQLFSCSSQQLTVDEAEAGLVAACALLARTVAAETPEQIDAVLSRVCAPGKTRAFMARVLAEELAKKNSGEVLEEFPADGTSVPPTTDGGSP